MPTTSRRALTAPILAMLTFALSSSLMVPEAYARPDCDRTPDARICGGESPRAVPPPSTAPADPWVTTWQAPSDAEGEWTSIHQPPSPDDDRFRRSTTPTGQKAWRAEVRHGDVAHNAAGKPVPGGWRAEGIGPSETAAEGTVRYQWRTMFPKGFPEHDNKLVWQVFAQWHQGDPSRPVGGPPPIAFTVDSGKMYVQLHRLVDGVSQYVGDYEIGDVAPGTWHGFLVDITWSTDPRVGSVRVRHNGVQVTFDGAPKYVGPTMYPGASGCPDVTIPASVDCTYLKMGFYRKQTTQVLKPFVVYHDDVRRRVQR